MKKYIFLSIKYVTPLLSVLLFASCGNGGGGSSYGGNPSPGYSSSSASMMSSSAKSSSVVSSSSASSAASHAGPVTQVTNIGGTFVAGGMVNVLVNTSGTLSVQQQNKTGMTLYTFDNDIGGQSACTSVGCISNWPPLLADANAVAVEPLTIIRRTDGNDQWALRDKPLYFYVGDTNAGDLNGEGVGTVWHVAIYEPVSLIKASLNAMDGDYFTASGNVLVGMPSGGNTAFVAERKNREGFSLYTFDNDTVNTSNCTDACLAAWPPLLADDNDKAEAPYSIITRSMGTTGSAKQWAYQGKPLYFFTSDTVAGQTSGKSIPNWHLARPMPVQVKSNASVGSLLAAAGWVKSATTVSGAEQINSSAKHGFTLYTFDNDTAGMSNCTGACLNTWPALIASVGAVAVAPYSLVVRTSGESQWALNGKPLYFYAGDTKAGDANGDYFNDIWHVARIPPVAVDNNSAKGKLFVAHGNIIDAAGAADLSRKDFTLYTFDNDPVGSTTCFNSCLTTWPALYAPADATAFGDFTVIARDSSTKQWAYKGKPLYFFVGDTAPDQTTGEYPSWTIARP